MNKVMQINQCGTNHKIQIIIFQRNIFSFLLGFFFVWISGKGLFMMFFMIFTMRYLIFDDPEFHIFTNITMILKGSYDAQSLTRRTFSNCYM